MQRQRVCWAASQRSPDSPLRPPLGPRKPTCADGLGLDRLVRLDRLGRRHVLSGRHEHLGLPLAPVVVQRSEQYAPEGSRLALVLALLALAHARPHVTRRVHGVRLCEPEVEAYQPEVEPSPPPLLFCMPPRWLRDGGRGGSGEVAARDGERVLDSRPRRASTRGLRHEHSGA